MRTYTHIAHVHAHHERRHNKAYFSCDVEGVGWSDTSLVQRSWSSASVSSLSAGAGLDVLAIASLLIVFASEDGVMYLVFSKPLQQKWPFRIF
jgi:hypothetical protein